MQKLPYIQITAENGETVPEDILRNITTVLGTRRGEQALDRELGISWEAVDKPLPEAQRMISLDVVRQIQRAETRVRVVRVTFEADEIHGILGVLVVIALVADS